jgi:uncharacterized membrane protein YgdD (TMEM256/DUF423 family)
MEERTFFRLGALFALLGVALGAFGTHTLGGSVSPEDLATFETGVRYQVYHALGLLVVSRAVARWPRGAITSAGWLFVVGILVFSGSLYALVLSGERWMGAVTPVGGLCFLSGWGLLVWAAGKR